MSLSEKQYASIIAQWLTDYGDNLYQHALARVRSSAIAEELVQETLIAGLQAFASFKQQASVKTWLLSIMQNKVIDYLRQQKIELESLTDDDEPLSAELFDKHGHWQSNVQHWQTPETLLQNEQFWAIYQQCLNRLPENMATLFLLRAVDELPAELCCQLLNIATPNQLYVSLARTRLKLRECLNTYWFHKE
jgi:RNA polymerase sigma-70 factor (ECF subfamily)